MALKYKIAKVLPFFSGYITDFCNYLMTIKCKILLVNYKFLL